MKPYKIEITKPAENDLSEIGRYISKEFLDSDTAKRVVSKIANEIFSLELLPLRNALVTDNRLANKGVRKVMVDNYMIFYSVHEASQVITIIRILYGKRGWMNLL